MQDINLCVLQRARGSGLHGCCGRCHLNMSKKRNRCHFEVLVSHNFDSFVLLTQHSHHSYDQTLERLTVVLFCK